MSPAESAIEDPGAPKLPQHRVMADLDRELFESYRDFRSFFYVERDGGLDSATKELLFIAINTAIGNSDGALNHVDTAREAGVTRAQLTEALSLALLLGGAQSWVNVGVKVAQAWIDAE
ncbi:MAG TPA: carboxymuconolactone decarboxylase family protein [Solirubrobacteraceae bacterium]|jgi:AhpD family alkylhydroperoxidase|nr:carboxymuconolactone decarboxylase family protein [Solirubrobacteraceae bacterium]